MRKTAFCAALTLGLATLSASSFAQSVDCFGPDSDQVCETVTLIDFNGDPAIENASMEFGDWTQKLQGGYNESRGDLSISIENLSGTNGSYNYSGVKGTTPFFFSSGSQLRVVFKNTSETGFYFYPYLSFDDPDSRQTADNGQWLKPDELVYLPPLGEETVTFDFRDDLYNEGTFDQVSVNYYVHDANQHVMGVDRIEYAYVTGTERAACNAPDLTDTYDCESYTLVKFLQTKDRTLSSMAVASFNGLIDNTHNKVSDTGVGVTTHIEKRAANAENEQFLPDYANYAGVTSDTTYTFVPGDVIRVTMRTDDINGPVILYPSISFQDPDSIAYSDPGLWYDTTEVTVDANQSFITTDFVFDAASAGTYSLINFSSNIKHDGELAIEKLELLTRTPAADVVR